MKDGADIEGEVRALAEAYCTALHHADAAALGDLCHARFFMTSVQDGREMFLDREAFLGRVGSRDAFPGAPRFEIMAVDVEAPEMAHVKLAVHVPPRLFHDYLGFFRTDAGWKLITKLFRTADGPPLL